MVLSRDTNNYCHVHRLCDELLYTLPLSLPEVMPLDTSILHMLDKV